MADAPTTDRVQALAARRAGHGHAARRSRAATVVVSVTATVALVGNFAAGAAPTKRRAAAPAGSGASTTMVVGSTVPNRTTTAPVTTATTVAAGAAPPRSSTSSIAPPRGAATPPPTSGTPGCHGHGTTDGSTGRDSDDTTTTRADGTAEHDASHRAAHHATASDHHDHDAHRNRTELMELIVSAPVHETRLRVMGSDAHLVLVGGDPVLLDDARAHLELLEARWSRFRPSSELCRLDASPGRPVVVSRDTFAVIARAVEAWRLTGGRFDPTVLPALRAAGYDRDFAAVIADDGAVTTAPRGPMPAPGCAGIVLDSTVCAVTLPEGVVLDLGGIGKGFAADRVATALLAAGADGACVNLGGDLRVVGRAPEGSSWTIEVDDPLGSGTGKLLVAEGGVATSSRLRRAWRRAGDAVHHLIEPATGASARTGLASVTVVAGEAWWAEVLAKAAFVAGPEAGAALVRDAGATGLFLHDDGRVEELPGLDAFRPRVRAVPLGRM